MLGVAQMNWLKESLASSEAAFKVVALGNQVLNPKSGSEGLGHYPVEQAELLDFIRDAKINGVLFLSGDRHHTELVRIDREGQYPLYDFTSSPLTAGLWKLTPERPEFDNPARVEGTLVEQHNFGLLKFSGPRTDRRVTLETRDASGALLWSREIKRSEISFPGAPPPPRG
jgi:alkaline phosphatase D